MSFTKITDESDKIIWYQELGEEDQLAYKYGKPENYVYGEEGWNLRCQRHAGCPFDNSHNGICKKERRAEMNIM